ncbi:hypothetical protein SP19_173 [Salmonella phage 19]|nr:hypothetical protein SP19_173 [Salmonella phage 19]
MSNLEKIKWLTKHSDKNEHGLTTKRFIEIQNRKEHVNEMSLELQPEQSGRLVHDG